MQCRLRTEGDSADRKQPLGGVIFAGYMTVKFSRQPSGSLGQSGCLAARGVGRATPGADFLQQFVLTGYADSAILS